MFICCSRQKLIWLSFFPHFFSFSEEGKKESTTHYFKMLISHYYVHMLFSFLLLLFFILMTRASQLIIRDPKIVSRVRTSMATPISNLSHLLHI